MHIMVYTDSDSREAQPGELSGLIESTGHTIWVDMHGPTPEDLTTLRDVFNFHPLAIRDTTNHRQRSKMDEYPDYLFMILSPVSIEGQELVFRELDLFITHNAVVTVHKTDETRTINEVRRRLEHRPTSLPEMSASVIMYIIADAIVDEYFNVLDDISDRLEDLEDYILANPQQDALRRISTLKRMLIELWRVVWPQRHVINTLNRQDLPIIDHRMLRFHLRDVADHLLWVSDIVQTYRDTLSGVMELYMSATSNRLSHVINRLTILTVVLGLLTLVSAFYGMNFINVWPGYNTQWGFPVVIGLMMAITGGALLLFRKLKWI